MSWIQTCTGGRAYPLSLRPEQVCIEDIAGSLAKLCRFTGHCRKPYYVAQHCVIVAAEVQRVDPKLALAALLHEGGEPYLGDINRPVKRSLRSEITATMLDAKGKVVKVEGTGQYQPLHAAEEYILTQVFKGLDLSWPFPGDPARHDPAGERALAIIKEADDRALLAEARDLMNPPGSWKEWDEAKAGVQPLERTIVPWTWDRAERAFLGAYCMLREGHTQSLAETIRKNGG